ncbi:MAG: CoA-binding protein [Anaerostipes sp.]|jgi:predicted CoA-binding protein|uniref:CoA-binding domain-containing protein n=1 Tax=Blautia producta TaxID=33035 RepID=A0A4V0Z6Z0_9FIRM|nr:CoA-binding protein [Blautia producta]QBE94968.1 hypothetical protein PMF13cell1_00465 [Blautia producta]
MDLKEVMSKQSFVVIGDTLNKEKYAYKIKEGLKQKGYVVNAMGKEMQSLNDVDGDIDIVDLCTHPTKSLELLQECRKPYQCIVIQPGASNDTLVSYLQQHNIPYLDGCLLVGIKLYA